MFADNTALVISHSNFNSLIRNANDGLIAYTNWFNLNKLSLNVLFLVVRKIVPQVSTTKFLWVFVDESLSWRGQADDVSKWR